MSLTFKIPFTKHKYFEIDPQWMPDSGFIFEFSVAWTRKSDHAGLTCDFFVYNAYLGLNITDSRHWNDKKNNWYTVKEWDEYIESLDKEEEPHEKLKNNLPR